jgi:hypothetical protein
VAKCLGVSESNLTDPPASYDSPDFNDPNNNTISDTVGYRATPADQDAPFAVVSSDKVPACLGTAFTKVINDAIKHPTNPSDTLPEGVTVGTPTVSPMSFPQFGDKSTAYRTTIPISYKGLNLTAYLDQIFVVKGRAGVNMSFEATVTPYPAAEEERYTALVISRLTDTA